MSMEWGEIKKIIDKQIKDDDQVSVIYLLMLDKKDADKWTFEISETGNGWEIEN
jgi:hypothetical protein